jgi:DNA-binding response OmpR family regulator
MPKTILIAASDPNIIYLLQRYAETSGFQAVVAGQITELQRLVQGIRPALIVLEIELPSTPAKQVLKRLKADPTTNPIPVVIYSCYDEVAFSPIEGAASCLQKTVMYSDFVAVLEQVGVRPE